MRDRMFCEESLEKIKFRAFPKRVGPQILSLESLEKIKFRAFPKRVGPQILSLESVDYFGTSEHY